MLARTLLSMAVVVVLTALSTPVHAVSFLQATFPQGVKIVRFRPITGAIPWHFR